MLRSTLHLPVIFCSRKMPAEMTTLPLKEWKLLIPTSAAETASYMYFTRNEHAYLALILGPTAKSLNVIHKIFHTMFECGRTPFWNLFNRTCVQLSTKIYCFFWLLSLRLNGQLLTNSTFEHLDSNAVILKTTIVTPLDNFFCLEVATNNYKHQSSCNSNQNELV